MSSSSFFLAFAYLRSRKILATVRRMPNEMYAGGHTLRVLDDLPTRSVRPSSSSPAIPFRTTLRRFRNAITGIAGREMFAITNNIFLKLFCSNRLANTSVAGENDVYFGSEGCLHARVELAWLMCSQS